VRSLRGEVEGLFVSLPLDRRWVKIGLILTPCVDRPAWRRRIPLWAGAPRGSRSLFRTAAVEDLGAVREGRVLSLHTPFSLARDRMRAGESRLLASLWVFSPVGRRSSQVIISSRSNSIQQQMADRS